MMKRLHAVMVSGNNDAFSGYKPQRHLPRRKTVYSVPCVSLPSRQRLRPFRMEFPYYPLDLQHLPRRTVEPHTVITYVIYP